MLDLEQLDGDGRSRTEVSACPGDEKSSQSPETQTAPSTGTSTLEHTRHEPGNVDATTLNDSVSTPHAAVEEGAPVQPQAMSSPQIAQIDSSAALEKTAEMTENDGLKESAAKLQSVAVEKVPSENIDTAALEVHDDELEKRPVNPQWSKFLDKVAHAASLSGRAFQAMRAVDRGGFIPSQVSYMDTPISLGHSATISAPHMHALALKHLTDHLRQGARALDVGCGSGYICAVFAYMVGSMGKVVGIDYIEPLVEMSRRNLSKSHSALLESGRVELRVGDGWKGCPDEAPFDAIHVGAAADAMPTALIEQLRPGGRMVIPIGHVYTQVDKSTDGVVSKTPLIGVNFVPLVHLQN